MSDCASRPHKIATSGPPRATSASIARCVTCSQPLPRWDPERPGCTVSTRLSSSTPCCEPRRQIAAGCRTDAEIGVELGIDVLQRPWDRAHVRGHRERQAHRVPWGGVGILADDQDLHLAQRATECAQHVLAGWQIVRPAASSARRNAPIAVIVAATGCSASAQSGLTSSVNGRGLMHIPLRWPSLDGAADPRGIRHDSAGCHEHQGRPDPERGRIRQRVGQQAGDQRSNDRPDIRTHGEDRHSRAAATSCRITDRCGRAQCPGRPRRRRTRRARRSVARCSVRTGPP